ncbi:ABC transporter ATP-binding protein [Mechercharimyces sp. CAU 1602]|uniref:ABC transporter ATP-binding protein n=1 Tax=Mechercharimyces sp. CAU 1602 TaxID=2973933 RepID=UPI002163A5C0|nr:ABC transporter ATP-binding protein [Mechercharimyces sp. CAU 1602]MCS1352147.1 ABC transporter ATP-binding protein [Mechercharimyces sp. CAU 1602]
MIEVSRLVKQYGREEVVKGVSFTIKKEEVFGLLGPNGAGKTTTMEMIEGLRTPDGGQICIDGVDAVRYPKRIKQLIGVQLQSTSLFDHLKVKEIIRLYASFYEKSRPLSELLQAFHLEEKADALVKHLSGGQRQRLAIALAVVHDPKVIFLDEPTTGLDPKARRDLWAIVLQLKREGRTIFLSTHYMEEAEKLCDRVAIMNQGKVMAIDTPVGLIRSLASDSVIQFELESTLVHPHMERLHGVKEVHQSEQGIVTLSTDSLSTTLRELIALADEHQFLLAGLRTRSATLEDVFLERTGKRLTAE